MSLEKQIWSGHLIENFWRDNSFAKLAMQVAKEFIYGGKIVHQSKVSGRPTVQRNRTVFPATIGTRIDEDVLYMIDEYFVDPFRIPNSEQYELDYNKRESVIGEQSAAANQMAADWLLRFWFKYSQVNSDASVSTTQAQILRTTGGSTAASIGTGLRKLFTCKDLGRAKVLLNKNDVPQLDRYGLFDSDTLDQITQDEDYKKTWKAYENSLIEGTIGKVHGIWLMDRSKALEFNDAGTDLLAYGATPTDAANTGGIIWQKNGVETAIGEVEFFDEYGRPEYYGDIFSAILRSGGRIRRADSVIAMVQAAAA